MAKEVPIANTDEMDMIAIAMLLLTVLTSYVSPTSQSQI